MNYYLNIGTNIGDRHANIDNAVRLIEESLGSVVSRSTPIETAPWGFSSPNMFLNEGLLVTSSETPLEVLETLHAIEKKTGSLSHRNEDGSYTDRIIDIDIIAIDDMIINTPALAVPHRHLSERDFFLVPMVEIAPAWVHPVTHRTALQMLQELAI